MNKSSTTNPIKILRAALLLLTLLLPAAAAMADDFITDVLVVGNKNQTEFNSLISSLVSAGWTDINQDLNQGCGGNSAYIHLLYKRQSSTAITGFYIRTGSNPPDNLTHEGHTYYLVPCQGSESFVNGHGDLNAGCGSGSAYIFLYYTKDVLSDNTGVTGITFNTTQSGAVGANGGTTGYDLNSGGGGDYIYMHLTTASGGNVVTLSSGSGNVALQNGHILTGTGGTETQVTIADGATVTFNGVNNTAIPDNSSHQWPGISCLGNATIVLNGSTTNSVKGGRGGSGIHVAANKTLTIQGSGTLNATGGYRGAGIGSGWGDSCGNITISGGTITANGDDGAAGIGSGWQSSCGNITISGGTVTATGGASAAGIGSGYYNSSCGNITITNGVTRVTATKGQSSNNAVGAGNSSTCGTVTIGGVQTGNINMSPFVTYPYTVAFDSNGGTGTMANQSFMYNVAQNLTANAFSNTGRQFIGWATTANGPKVYNNGQSVSNLTQTAGATVTLYAKWGKTVTLTSSTGEVLLQNGDTLTGTGGSSTRVKIADGATVTFSGVNNTAISNDSDHSWPGIDCLGNATIVLNGNTTNSVKGGYFSPGIYVAANKTLTIQGSGTLNATGRARGAAIGSGYQSSCGNITINSGTVNAIGGSNAAAIGSGYDYASCGDITINGGTVNATGGYYAAGIGSGCHHSSCGAITISGGTVTANGDERGAGIGSGYEYSSCGTITISGGTVTANGGQLAAAIGSGYYFASCGNITITNGVTRVTATKHIHSTNTIGAGGNGGTCGTITIDNVQQTEFITMSPFETYPYTVAFDANGGTGTMANQSFMYNVARNLIPNSFTRTNYVFEGWATSATGPKVYDDGQNVSNLTQNSGSTVTLFAKWTTDPTHLSVSGNVYTIHTATGWDVFCDLLAENSNGFFTGKTIKLDTDISVTRMAGSSGHEFSGTFDGQGHTLTVSYQNTDNDVRTAPFSYIDGATIQNLIVAGSITGTHHRAAGIVGETGSNLSHVTNCLSSVNVSGGQYTAGISIGGKVEITGCVFNGTIIGTNMSGGFVGYSNSALVISDCLFTPQEGSAITGGTFYYNGGGDITPVNSYYTTPLGTPQGKQAHSIAGDANVTVAFSGQATTYDMSGISAYSVGMVYDSTLYAGNGDTVSLDLSCTPPAGYVCSGYTTDNGSLTGTANPYTLTMPDENVTIQALEQLTSVTYIDGDGEHICDNFTMLEGGDTLTLTQGWYVANKDITYTGTLTLAGDVNLILCNGKTMTVNPGSGNSICGLINMVSGFALTIYGQTLDSVAAGTLYVTNNVVGKNAIDLNTYTQHSGNVVVNDSGDAVIHAGDFTLNGGTINATGRECIRASNVTINGGIVNATGSHSGICGISNLTINGGSVKAIGSFYGIYAEEGNIIINGGTVNATSFDYFGIYSLYNLTLNGGTVNATNSIGSSNGIFAGVDIILGWTNIIDHILASSYQAGGTVSVKSGQKFYYQNGNEPVFVSDTLDEDQIEAIGGKTLIPFAPVAYIDENGVQQQCNFYTVVNNNLDFDNLPAGWYVVSNDITLDRDISFSGDAHLILCDSTAMNISVGIDEALYADGSLTLYGQSGGTGSLTALSLFGHGIDVFGNLTINGGTVNAISISGGKGIYSEGIVTINGGTVNAISISGGKGIYSEGIVTINGGTVTALSDDFDIFALYQTINGGTVNATNSGYGIYAEGDIILGWTNTDDYILASSYMAVGTVSVKSGQAFYYIDNGNKHSTDTVVISGTLNEAQIAAIGGKTLVPYNVYPVAYIDENGVEQQCTAYTVVTNDLNFGNLPAGWYVVNDSITINSSIFFTGDAHLILCDSTTMNISFSADIALQADGSLTLYGQSGGTGSLTATSGHGHGINATNLTINGSTVNATSTDDSGTFNGISATNLTINGSTVTATGGYDGIVATNLTINGSTVNASASGDIGVGIEANKVTINSGTVNATGNGSGIYIYNPYGYVTINGGTVTTNEIYSPIVTLGWSNLNDSITVGNFDYWSTPTVSVKSGQAFCYRGESGETVIISDTLNSDQIDSISWKTLRPYVVARTVAGFGQGNGGWALIASPFGATNPLNVAGMLSGNHDLYAFVPNPSDSLEWRNYVADTFNLEAGKGYLYANADTVTLTFNGMPYSGNGEVALVYDATDARKCWNLVGNPFPYAAYLDRPYYVLNADGTDINPESIPASVPVPPCTAVFVKAVSVNDRAVFSVTAP